MIGNFIGSPIGGIISSGINATASITLADTTLVATGTIAIVGQEAVILNDAVLFATGRSDTITSYRANAKVITGSMSNFTNITTPRVNNPQITA